MSNNENKNFERARSFFVNPEDPSTAEDLAILSADAIRAMAQIYATGGDIEQMDSATSSWLSQNPSRVDVLQKIIGDVLKKESETRRFDHLFMGQIHPQGSKVGILGNLIAAYMNNNLIVSEVSQAETQMEKEVVDWLANLVGYTETASGNITTGGTTANIAALAVARNKKLEELGFGKSDDEILPQTHPVYLLTSKWRHYSIDKACDLLGMGLITIPSDDFKIDTRLLEQKIIDMRREGKAIAGVVGLAGETETGMVEDLNKLSEVANKHGVYLHIDAAYGGPFLLSRAKGLFRGIENADSITFDPHKLLFVPYSAGAIIFKDKENHDLLQTHTRYLDKVAATISGTRGSGGVISTYATWKLLGEEGLTALLDHTLDLAEFAHDRVTNSPMLKPLHEQELNTVLIGLEDEARFLAREGGMTDKEIEKAICESRNELDKRRVNDPYISANEGVDKDENTGFVFSGFRYIGMHPYTSTKEVEDTISKLEQILMKNLKVPE